MDKLIQIMLKVKSQLSIVRGGRGQALTTLIFFMIFGITITTAAVSVLYMNSLSATRFQDGAISYQAAQSGADNALIRIIREPSYTGETLSVGSGSATIIVAGSGTAADPYIITSTGRVRGYVKKIEVRATYLNNKMNILSQKELF